MGDFRRHVVAGDKLSVLFRYHIGQPDLEVSVIDMKKSLRGTGTLASDEKYSVVSNSVPELNEFVLYVRGTDSSADHNVDSYIYDSVEERNAALLAFSTLIANINGMPVEIMVPESLGGMPRAFGGGFVATKLEDGGKQMFKIRKNTLATNLLDAQLIVEVPGLGAGDVKVAQPAGKEQLLVVYTIDGKEQEPISYALADAEINAVTAKVDKGIFTLTVNYNLGTPINVTDGSAQ